MNDPNIRERAKKEASADLDKSIEELLCDVHEHAIAGSPGGLMGGYPVQSMLHAQKHMVSMMAKITLSNEKAARANNRLAWAVAALTVVSTITGIIQAIGVFASWPSQ